MLLFTALPLIGLTLLAVLSPLLTFSALFQQKEWRMDRLREHLRRDGWFGQLFGRSRPVIVLIAITSLMTMLASTLALVWLAFLAALSFLQIVLRRQRYPRPTGKAVTLILTAIILDLLCIELTGEYVSLYILIIAQPIIVIIAWLLWKPVDFMLKKRVMDKAAMLRSRMENATVIGIAGSVGKTTVKELIAHLVQDLNPLMTPAHMNTEMGVAQWFLSRMTTKSSQLIIVEMGAYRKGEIATLCRIAQPTIGVMTALGSDHVALFGSEENIIKANGELIASLPSTGHAFFYGDNEGCRQVAKKSPCPATIVIADPSLKHSLQGHHNDGNVALAVAVARHLGITEKRIAELLETFRPQAHTFSLKTERGVLVLDDTYNISPLSMAAALDWAAERPQHPRTLLTSGLQETGSDEHRYLQELGKKAAKSVERVIFTNKHGSEVFAKAFGEPVEVLNANTERVQSGSVLLAVGRMPLSTINRLLPPTS